MKKETDSDDKSIVVDDFESRRKDLDWAIGLNRVCLKLMGIWPEAKDDKTSTVKFLSIVLPVSSMMFSMICFMLLPQMYALVLVSNDLLLVLDNLMTNCPAFTSCIKLFLLCHGTETLIPVVDTVTEDWLRPKMPWEFETMRKEAYIAKVFTIGGYVIVAGAYLGYVFAPLFGLNIRIITNITDYGDRNLPIQSYYPYDYSKSPNYEITHISQILAGTFIIMVVAIPDNFFGALVFHMSAQFKILGVSMEHFVKKNNASLMHYRSKAFNKRLGLYVRRHVHLIRMISALEKTFNFLILSQLFCMCVMACCLTFRILYSIHRVDEKTPIFQTVNLAAALFSVMLFTLVDCTASEILATHSSALFYHVYNCNWYMIPKQSIRDFILIMLISKNPQILTAGKIIPLSLSSYCVILKSIGGYLSVLIAASS